MWYASSPPLSIPFFSLGTGALDDFIGFFNIAAGSAFDAFDTPVALTGVVALEMAVTDGDEFAAAIAVAGEFIAGQ